MKDSLFYTINFNDVRKLWRDIRAHHSCRSESRPAVTQVFFDTFDWRLWQKDLTLIREENDLKLSDVEPLQPSLRESWRRKAQPKFWWQFPDGPMKDALQSLLGVRALMSLAAIQKTRRTMSLLNEDGKTVLKIHHDYIHLKDVSERCKNIHILWLQPIRGYKNDLQKFQKFLRERDLTKSEEWVYSRILKAVGRRPGDYTSKFRLDLTPNLNSDKALRMILRYLIDVMKSNEEGIKADTDTEFLHDFRVSSRRIRSALGQIKGVLPKDKTDQFRRDFSILGKSTNRLRDLDVYLLKKEQYRELLPKHTVGGLDPFFQDVSDARRAELNKVKKFLKSSIYRELMSRWEEFIDTEMGGPGEEAKNAQKPVFEVAQRVIFRRYRQVIRGGKGIHDHSPDEQLHRLRIECKRLRYLLEFFACLFPKKDMLSLIGQLKKLQDNLGDFNDLCVQQEYLKEYLNQIKKNRVDALLTAAAIGGLITALSQKQRLVRSEFKQRFDVFSARGNHALFIKLFKPRLGGGAKG